MTPTVASPVFMNTWARQLVFEWFGIARPWWTSSVVVLALDNGSPSA